MTDPQSPQQPPAQQPPAYMPPPAPDASYGAQPAYAGPDAPVPGKTLGIVALIVAFFFSVVGIILGFVAKSQSKKAGVRNTPATVAIVLGFVFLVLQIIGAIIVFALFGQLIFGIAEVCSQYGPGEHLVNGFEITCR